MDGIFNENITKIVLDKITKMYKLKELNNKELRFLCRDNFDEIEDFVKRRFKRNVSNLNRYQLMVVAERFKLHDVDCMRVKKEFKKHECLRKIKNNEFELKDLSELTFDYEDGIFFTIVANRVYRNLLVHIITSEHIAVSDITTGDIHFMTVCEFIEHAFF